MENFRPSGEFFPNANPPSQQYKSQHITLQKPCSFFGVGVLLDLLASLPTPSSNITLKKILKELDISENEAVSELLMEIPELSNESADFLWESSKDTRWWTLNRFFHKLRQLLGCPRQLVNRCKWLGSMDYNLLIHHEVSWGYERSYEPFTNFLGHPSSFIFVKDKEYRKVG